MLCVQFSESLLRLRWARNPFVVHWPSPSVLLPGCRCDGWHATVFLDHEETWDHEVTLESAKDGAKESQSILGFLVMSGLVTVQD